MITGEIFEMDGKKYVAKEDTSIKGCVGCAFEHDELACHRAPDCIGGVTIRAVNDLIFVEVTE